MHHSASPVAESTSGLPAKLRGKGGRRSPFSTEQQSALEAYVPGLEQVLVKHGLHVMANDNRKKDHETAVKKWLDETISQCIKLPVFADLDMEKKDEVQWKKASFCPCS
jgi:hypothetical protein